MGMGVLDPWTGRSSAIGPSAGEPPVGPPTIDLPVALVGHDPRHPSPRTSPEEYSTTRSRQSSCVAVFEGDVIQLFDRTWRAGAAYRWAQLSPADRCGATVARVFQSPTRTRRLRASVSATFSLRGSSSGNGRNPLSPSVLLRTNEMTIASCSPPWKESTVSTVTRPVFGTSSRPRRPRIRPICPPVRGDDADVVGVETAIEEAFDLVRDRVRLAFVAERRAVGRSPFLTDHVHADERVQVVDRPLPTGPGRLQIAVVERPVRTRRDRLVHPVLLPEEH